LEGLGAAIRRNKKHCHPEPACTERSRSEGQMFFISTIKNNFHYMFRFSSAGLGSMQLVRAFSFENEHSYLCGRCSPVMHSNLFIANFTPPAARIGEIRFKQ